MTTLEWDAPSERVIEQGVDRGVLYTKGNHGVVWNGLVSVTENPVHKVEPVWMDGVRVNDIVIQNGFKGAIRAYTYPEELEKCVGVREDDSGLNFLHQSFEMFDMSYRTGVATDTDGGSEHYKIHLLYGLTAVPAPIQNRTLTDGWNPLLLQWSVTSVPQRVDNYLPTGHIVLDSRKVDPLLLSDLEDILYGDGTSPPYLPPAQILQSIIRNWERMVITDNLDGTWTATEKNDGQYITWLSADEFEITSDSIFGEDADSYYIRSTDKNLEE